MSKGSRESFVFYRSFFEAICELQKGEQLKIYNSIASYSLNREEPKLAGRVKVVWLLIKPQLDANWRKFEKGCLGGAPKGNYNAQKTTSKQPQNNLKQPNDNVNDNVNDNENVNDNAYEESPSPSPSLSDIEIYIAENNLAVEPGNFYDYYSSKGWMMGKNPMVDWRAALRNWSRKSQSESIDTLKITTYDL